MLVDIRVLKVKTRKVTKLPIQVVLPERFVQKNLISRGDTIEFWLSESGELLIKAGERCKNGSK